MIQTIKKFMKKDSSLGIFLTIVTILALILQNGAMYIYYTEFLHTPVEISFVELHIAKPLLFWVNDALMAIFFFVI